MSDDNAASSAGLGADDTRSESDHLAGDRSGALDRAQDALTQAQQVLKQSSRWEAEEAGRFIAQAQGFIESALGEG